MESLCQGFERADFHMAGRQETAKPKSTSFACFPYPVTHVSETSCPAFKMVK